MSGKRLASKLCRLLARWLLLICLLAIFTIYRNELASPVHGIPLFTWILLPILLVLGACAALAAVLVFGMILRGFHRNYERMEADQRQAWKSHIKSISGKGLRLRDEQCERARSLDDWGFWALENPPDIKQ
jgi:hypothetical protein